LLGAGGAISEIPEIFKRLGSTTQVGKADKHACCRPAKGCSGGSAGGGYRLDPGIRTTQVGGSQADIKYYSRSWYKSCNIQAGNHFPKTLDIEQMFCYTIFVRNKRRRFIV